MAAGLAKTVSVAKRFKATILLTAILVVSYLVLSQGNLFIERELLLALSFSLGRPLNMLSYMVSHMSLWHLAVNVVSLLLFAAIVEVSLSSRDVFGIFLFSGALTVAIFSLLNPGAELIGASAGVSAIMTSAFVLNVRKAIVYLVIVLVLFLLAFPGINFVVQWQEDVLAQENQELASQLGKAVETGNQEAVVRITNQKRTVEREISSFEESKELASSVEVDPFLHSYAAALGAVYLLLFRKGKTIALVKKQKLPGFGKK